MVRHKRHGELWPSERQRFLRASTHLHNDLMELQRILKPQCDQSRAIGRLHAALLISIREVTGEDPPWMKTHPSAGGPMWGAQRPPE